VNAIIEERNQRGKFTNIKDFITRMADSDVNKRLVENFIKAGAFDTIPGTRKQLMAVYGAIMENTVRDKKNNMAGQMTLFDLADESEKENYDIKLPDVGEYDKEVLLAFEKEVIGIYVSGHPLEEYENLLKKHSTAKTSDFYLDEEQGKLKVTDGANVTIGGMIADKKIKYTKNDKVMAFVTLEDLYGSVEVIVFPRDYEKNAQELVVDSKVFITGRVQADDEKDGRLIASSIVAFEDIPKTLWLQFENKEHYVEKDAVLQSIFGDSEGRDTVMILLKDTKQCKKLPPNCNVKADADLLKRLSLFLGKDNVKVV
jgi:DNA polymerase-3 subunit alpha